MKKKSPSLKVNSDAAYDNSLDAGMFAHAIFVRSFDQSIYAPFRVMKKRRKCKRKVEEKNGVVIHTSGSSPSLSPPCSSRMSYTEIIGILSSVDAAYRLTALLVMQESVVIQ